MLASELIDSLKDLINVAGNREVRFPDWDYVKSRKVERVEQVEKDYMACDDLDEDEMPKESYFMVDRDY